MEKKSLKDVCNSAVELEAYLISKADNHNCYKTYSTVNRVQSWLDENYIYLDDGSGWNDVNDRNLFNSYRGNIKQFGRCFSFSKSESVAMWMLYGGLQKKGAMLEFSQKAMRELVNNTKQVVLGNWINHRFIPVVTLTEGQFRLFLKDILYIGDRDSRGVYIKRSDEAVKDAPPTVIDQLERCTKHSAWSYENECRLILSVDKGLLANYPPASSAQVSLMDLAEKQKYLTTYCAPNFEGTKPYLPSRISGIIDWNLCKECPQVEELNKRLHVLETALQEHITV